MYTKLTPDQFQSISFNHKRAIQMAFSHLDPAATGFIPIRPSLFQLVNSINGSCVIDPDEFENTVFDILAFIGLEEGATRISLRDTMKVMAYRAFNEETSRKDVQDSFQILKNLTGEISTVKMKTVLCKVFDKVEVEHVEQLIGNLETATRTLEDHEVMAEDAPREMEFIKNNKDLHDELLTRF